MIERGSDDYRALADAVREADMAFEKAGDAGTRTWLDDYFLPELQSRELTVAALAAQPASSGPIEQAGSPESVRTGATSRLVHTAPPDLPRPALPQAGLDVERLAAALAQTGICWVHPKDRSLDWTRRQFANAIAAAYRADSGASAGEGET